MCPVVAAAPHCLAHTTWGHRHGRALRPVPCLHTLFPGKTAGKVSAPTPTGTLLIECNQYVLVILSAGPFLLFAASLKLISLVTFCVIKQYYLLLEPQQGNKLASALMFCHTPDQL